ncbi:B3 domain-containing protein At4g02870-like [Silene latifolia]|uniref:B3 domain-containing protein At4g02870-like n=1 Tax=Silene latifolia TaxID=37657 RepID=UPI003D777FC3
MAFRNHDSTYYDFMGSEGGNRELAPPYPVEVELNSLDVLNGVECIYLNNNSVQANIIARLPPFLRNKFNCQRYLVFEIHDTESKLTFGGYQLRFAYNTYYLMGSNWSRDFIQRKHLKAGDKIGFRLQLADTIQFSVISRASRP